MTIIAMTLPSCISESGPEGYADSSEETLVVLNIGVAGAGRQAREVDDNTKIHSLRVVILNGDEVEYNDKIYLEQPVQEYSLMYLVKAGTKRVYLIANSEDIDLYQYGETPETDDTGATAPALVKVDIDDFFEGFPAGSTGFEDAVKCLFYQKDYFDTALSDTHPLPLTSIYDIQAVPKTTNEYTLWLVRGATKYTVHFQNSRTEKVFLHDLSISRLYDQMYLTPHVGAAQHTISGTYWIDWLNEVANLSHLEENFNDPEFNPGKGWITDYSIPGNSNPFDLYLVKDDNIEIAGLQTDASGKLEPGKKDLGPYYSTEGKNLLTGGAPDAQQYILNIKLTDNKTGKEVEQSRILPSLGALFRNTHVIINITFDESYMHVYAEIVAWQTYDVYGKLTEE